MKLQNHFNNIRQIYTKQNLTIFVFNFFSCLANGKNKELGNKNIWSSQSKRWITICTLELLSYPWQWYRLAIDNGHVAFAFSFLGDLPIYALQLDEFFCKLYIADHIYLRLYTKQILCQKYVGERSCEPEKIVYFDGQPLCYAIMECSTVLSGW